MSGLRGMRVGFWLAAAMVSWPGLVGCGSADKTNQKTASPLAGTRIVVAAVGDPAVLPTVSAQRGEWEADRAASATLLETAVTPGATGGAHVLVFRGDQLGDLVDAGALVVLPEALVQPQRADDAADGQADPTPDRPREGTSGASEGDTLQFSDVFPAYRDQVSKYGVERMAFPYAGSALVLVTNRAAFDRPEIQAAAKAAGVSLGSPTTWTRLDAQAAFFQGRDWNGDGSSDRGIALALGVDPEGVADAIYLSRAASLGQHRDHYSLLFDSDTMEPRLTSPPFVEALERLVALKASGPPGVEDFDAEAARAAFRKGDVALLIDRAERAARWGGGAAKRIGVAPLPGSERVYEPSRKVWETAPAASPNRPSYLPFGGGWLVGVSSGARGREREAAIDFAKYLINPETASRVRSEPTFPVLPVRGTLVAQGLPDLRLAPGVESRPWGEAVAKTLGAARVVPGLRVPQAEGYLDDLSKGRASASKGRPAAEALGEVSAAWSARTRSLGLERQLWHYRRSLNFLVTTPRPPDRPGR